MILKIHCYQLLFNIKVYVATNLCRRGYFLPIKIFDVFLQYMVDYYARFKGF